jgi:hypothetical protein
MDTVARKADALALLCAAALNGPARLVVKSQQRIYAIRVLCIPEDLIDAFPEGWHPETHTPGGARLASSCFDCATTDDVDAATRFTAEGACVLRARPRVSASSKAPQASSSSGASSSTSFHTTRCSPYDGPTSAAPTRPLLLLLQILPLLLLLLLGRPPASSPAPLTPRH